MMTPRERYARLAMLPDAGLRALVADAFNIRPADRSLAVLRVLHCQGEDQQATDWLAAWFAVHPEYGQVAH
jgi:hypothetical protein